MPLLINEETLKLLAKRQRKLLSKTLSAENLPSLMTLQETLAQSAGHKNWHAAQAWWRDNPEASVPAQPTEAFRVSDLHARTQENDRLVRDLLDSAMQSVTHTRQWLRDNPETFMLLRALSQGGQLNRLIFSELAIGARYDSALVLRMAGLEITDRDLLATARTQNAHENALAWLIERTREHTLKTSAEGLLRRMPLIESDLGLLTKILPRIRDSRLVSSDIMGRAIHNDQWVIAELWLYSLKQGSAAAKDAATALSMDRVEPDHAPSQYRTVFAQAAAHPDGYAFVRAAKEHLKFGAGQTAKLLVAAARSGSADTLRFLMDGPVSSETLNRALAAAVNGNNIEAFDQLLAKGANPEKMADHTPLSYFISRNTEHPQFGQMLARVLARADINEDNASRETLAHVMMQDSAATMRPDFREVLGKLQVAGLNLDAQESHGATPLMLSCGYLHGQYANLEATGALLSLGANPDIPDRFGDRPLNTYLRVLGQGHASMLSNFSLALLATPAAIAQLNEKSMFQQHLYPPRLIEVLCQYGATVGPEEASLWLEMAASRNDGYESQKKETRDEEDLARFKIAIGQGVSINEVNKAGKPLVQMAAALKHTKVLAWMIEQGADLSVFDDAAVEGATPINRLFLMNHLSLAAEGGASDRKPRRPKAG